MPGEGEMTEAGYGKRRDGLATRRHAENAGGTQGGTTGAGGDEPADLYTVA